jgi:SH3 domain-containing YSC84-like protein 1
MFPACLLRPALRLLACGLFFSTAALRADSAPAAAEPDRMTARIETCEAILREFQADPRLAIPAEILRAARALVIVNQVKGGLVLGLQYGYGVILARRPDGSWSVPVFLKAGEASLGLQLGGQRAETLYVLMNDDAARLLFNGRVNIGVDASAVAGPRTYESGKVNREILTTPLLVYGRNHGYYAGATVKTGWLERNDQANRDYYRTPYTLPEILFGDTVAVTPAVRPLVDYVTEITR